MSSQKQSSYRRPPAVVRLKCIIPAGDILLLDSVAIDGVQITLEVRTTCSLDCLQNCVRFRILLLSLRCTKMTASLVQQMHVLSEYCEKITARFKHSAPFKKFKSCRSTRRRTVQRHAEPRRAPLASRVSQNHVKGRASDIQNINHAPTHVSPRLAPVPDHSTTPALQRTPFTPRRRSQDRVQWSRAFCHAAPTVWNSLPLDLTDDFNTAFLSTFKKDRNTNFYRVHSHVTVFRACDSFLTDIWYAIRCVNKN